MERMRRARRTCRGVSLTEFMVASSIATMLGGVMVVLNSGMSSTYDAQITVSQLSGYLDAATEQLKRDIWSASAATGQAGDGRCTTGVGAWLSLTVSAGTINYCLDTALANNIRLRRTDAGGAQRFLVHHIFEGAGETDTAIEGGGTLVRINIHVRKTVNGHDLDRKITTMRYRRQT